MFFVMLCQFFGLFTPAPEAVSLIVFVFASTQLFPSFVPPLLKHLTRREPDSPRLSSELERVSVSAACIFQMRSTTTLQTPRCRDAQDMGPHFCTADVCRYAISLEKSGCLAKYMERRLITGSGRRGAHT